jgi:hypothetical protein
MTYSIPKRITSLYWLVVALTQRYMYTGNQWHYFNTDATSHYLICSSAAHH